MNKKSMGSFLSELRKEKGLTQRELAEILNVSDKTVSHWERDEHSPDLSTIPIIAEFFGVSCDELIKGGRRSESSSPEPSSFSTLAQNSENFVKKTEKQKIFKAYVRHRILCLSSVFVSFFLLMLLIGIILIAEHLTGLDYVNTAGCISVAFSVALCLLTAFISNQNFISAVNSAELSPQEKKKLKTKGILNCVFPVFYVALLLIIIFKALMPVSSPSNNEALTMPVPSSAGPDTSFYDASSLNYADTSELIY